MPADAGRIRERPHGICKCMQYAGARRRRAILRNHPGDAALVRACTTPALSTQHEPLRYLRAPHRRPWQRVRPPHRGPRRRLGLRHTEALGSDTFVVRNGKIVTQTFAGRSRRNLELNDVAMTGRGMAFVMPSPVLNFARAGTSAAGEGPETSPASGCPQRTRVRWAGPLGG